MSSAESHCIVFLGIVSDWFVTVLLTPEAETLNGFSHSFQRAVDLLRAYVFCIIIQHTARTHTHTIFSQMFTHR